MYAWVFPYLFRVNNPNENTRVYQVMALVDHGTVKLDPVVEVFGWTNDMARVPEPGGGSHLASVKGPLTTCLGVPVYAAQRVVLAAVGKRPPDPMSSKEDRIAWLRTTTIVLQAFAVHLPCFLFLVWLEHRLRAVAGDASLRFAVVAVVGLGTNYLAYAFLFASHALSSIAAFVALDLVFRERRRTRGDASLADPKLALATGLALGASTLLELQGLFVSAPLGLYALSIFRGRRTLPALGLGVGACAAVLMAFQWRSFGSPLATGHLYMQTQAYAALWKQGVLGFVPPTREALLGLAFDRGYGLFGTSPGLWLVALAPLALVSSDKETRILLLVALGTAVTVWLAISSSLMWRGGWTVGPRYLGALPGLLAPVIAACLTATRAALSVTVARTLAGGLALASFFQMGMVGLLVSTLPESIVRPVPQIVVPFLVERRVPHLLSDLWMRDPQLFWVAPAAAVGALLMAVGGARGEDRDRVPLRLLATVALAVIALRPALSVPAGEAKRGEEVRAFFESAWEPR